jgi:hypothetical protein
MGILNNGFNPINANFPTLPGAGDTAASVDINGISAPSNVNASAVYQAAAIPASNAIAPSASEDTYSSSSGSVAKKTSLTPWQATKAIFKGLVSPLTDPFQSTSKFCFTLAMFILHAGIIAATGGAAAPVFLALGAGMALYQAGKGGHELKNAKTPEEKEKALTSLGASIANIGLLGVGAKPALKEASAAGVELPKGVDPENSSTLKSTWDSFKLIPNAIKKSFSDCRDTTKLKTNTTDFVGRQWDDAKKVYTDGVDAIQKAHKDGNGQLYATAKNLTAQAMRSLSITSLLRIGGATPN